VAEDSILGQSELVAFIPTTHPEQARGFYKDVLGLHLVSDERPFALVFDANGITLRVTVVQEHHPAPFTVLGWQVDRIESVVDRLADAGVACLRYPGLNDVDSRGLWTSPGGLRVAWFHDPDGNVLSVTESPNPTH